MRISRHVIGTLMGIMVLVALTIVFSSNDDVSRKYNVDVDTDYYLPNGTGITEIQQLSEDMSERMEFSTDASLIDKVGALLANGIDALGLVWLTIGLPFKILNYSIIHIFSINVLFLQVFETLVILAIIFTIIAIKTRSDRS